MALNNCYWASNRQTMQAALPLAFRRSEVNRPLEFGFEQQNFNGYQNYSYSRAYNFDKWDHFNSSHQNLQCAPQPTNRQFSDYSQFEPHQNPRKPAWESSLENYIKSQAEWAEKMEESIRKLNSNIDLLMMQSKMLQTRIAQQADGSSCINQGDDESVQDVGASYQNATALNHGEFNYSSHCAPAPLECDSDAPAPLACDSGAPAPLECDSGAPAPLACDFSAPASLECDSGAPAPLACDSAMGAVQIKNANIINSLGDTSSKVGCISNSSHNEKNSGLMEKSSDATYDLGDKVRCKDKVWCETKHEPPIAEEDGPNHDYLLKFLALDPGEKRVLISLAAFLRLNAMQWSS